MRDFGKPFFVRIKVIPQWRFTVIALTMLLWGCSKSEAPIVIDPPFIAPAVAYQPRHFEPGSESYAPTREQIADDLRQLRKTGFRSLVTYGSNGALGLIPEIARREGFDGTIIMGIWNPHSREEWHNAVAQANFVDGYCIGNEGLGVRYSTEELTLLLRELRRVTGRPVTTTEPIDSYLYGPHREWLLTNSDWLFPLAQPYWAFERDAMAAVSWLVARHDLIAATTGKAVILKEAGVPTGASEHFNEDTQASFFQELDSTGLKFFYFEAFDQPWKTAVLKHPEVEAHWGLYRADGTPKKVISQLSALWSQR